MSQPAPSNYTEFAEEMATLGEAFIETRALVESGQPVDLSGLDERINNFCDRLMASDDTTKQNLLPGLTSLLLQLEQLEGILRRMQEAFERNRAASAYGKKDSE
jgi:hypothetical protein